MKVRNKGEECGLTARVRRHREGLYEAGLRPVQLWLPDTRRAGFAAECRHQCITVRATRPGRHRRIELRRGDLVALAGPDPLQLALVMQRDQFEAHSSVTLLRLTRDVRAVPLLRVPIAAAEGSAPLSCSRVMIDPVQSVPRWRIRLVIGRLTADSLRGVDRALAIFLGIDSRI